MSSVASMRRSNGSVSLSSGENTLAASNLPTFTVATDGVGLTAPSSQHHGQASSAARQNPTPSGAAVDVGRGSAYRPGMNRRGFLLTTVAGALAAARVAEAQQPVKVHRIGMLFAAA